MCTKHLGLRTRSIPIHLNVGNLVYQSLERLYLDAWCHLEVYSTGKETLMDFNDTLGKKEEEEEDLHVWNWHQINTQNRKADLVKLRNWTRLRLHAQQCFDNNPVQSEILPYYLLNRNDIIF